MSGPDAHLYATDAALYSHGLDPGPDLYATDAALFAPALDPGPDLYATDAALFADAGDRATAALRALERWLVARSFARETDPRGDEEEAAEEETCAVCLGTVSSRGCASTTCDASLPPSARNATTARPRPSVPRVDKPWPRPPRRRHHPEADENTPRADERAPESREDDTTSERARSRRVRITRR